MSLSAIDNALSLAASRSRNHEAGAFEHTESRAFLRMHSKMDDPEIIRERSSPTIAWITAPATSAVWRPMSHSESLFRLTTREGNAMIRWVLHRAVRKIERNWQYDASYMHDIIDVSPRAAWLFSRVTTLGHRPQMSQFLRVAHHIERSDGRAGMWPSSSNGEATGSAARSVGRSNAPRRRRSRTTWSSPA